MREKHQNQGISALSVVPVRRWSRAAANILRHQPVLIGWVHSSYARLLNVRTPCSRLLTLQGEGYLQAPLTLVLDAEITTLAQRLPTGAPVFHSVPGASDSLVALRLLCTGVCEWDGHVYPMPSLTSRILTRTGTTLAGWIVQHVSSRGLAPLLLALEGRSASLSLTCRSIYTVLAPLLVSHALSTAALLDLTSHLIGLGEGLTPSGDDFLMGVLAVLQVTGQLERFFPAWAQQQFLHDVTAGTSDLSAEFLRCALEGDFAEPFTLFLRSLFALECNVWPSHATTLAAVGHSSGVDAMVGVALGCRLLAPWL